MYKGIIPTGCRGNCLALFKGDTSETSEQVSNYQSTAGAGGAAIGAGSTGNVISITTSDVNALQANQNVSETAINAEGSTAAYALQALEQSQANQNVVVAGVVDANDAAAQTAEQVAENEATQSQNIASQALAGSGYGYQTTTSPETLGTDTTSSSGISLTNLTLIIGIIVSAATLYYYYKQDKAK